MSYPRGVRAAPWMAGDWLCPRCGDLQFARNVQCRVCGCLRPVHVPPGGGSRRNGAPMGRIQGSSARAGQQLFHEAIGSSGISETYHTHVKNTFIDFQDYAAPLMPKSVSAPNVFSHVSAGENNAVEEDVTTEALECPHHLAGAVIGRHGTAIASLRRDTRCRIEIQASAGMGQPRAITVRGPRPAVQDAIRRLQETMQTGVIDQKLGAGSGASYAYDGVVQNGGYPRNGALPRLAAEEDRQKTLQLVDDLEARGRLKRAWLDERCMEVMMTLPFELSVRVLHEAERVDLWKTRNVSAFLMMLVRTVQQPPDERNKGAGPGRDAKWSQSRRVPPPLTNGHRGNNGGGYQNAQNGSGYGHWVPPPAPGGHAHAQMAHHDGTGAQSGQSAHHNHIGMADGMGGQLVPVDISTGCVVPGQQACNGAIAWGPQAAFAPQAAMPAGGVPSGYVAVPCIPPGYIAVPISGHFPQDMAYCQNGYGDGGAYYNPADGGNGTACAAVGGPGEAYQPMAYYTDATGQCGAAYYAPYPCASPGGQHLVEGQDAHFSLEQLSRMCQGGVGDAASCDQIQQHQPRVVLPEPQVA